MIFYKLPLILFFTTTCISAQDEQMVEIYLPRNLIEIIEKQRSHGDIDVYSVRTKNENMLNIVGRAKKSALNVLKEANISYSLINSQKTAFESLERMFYLQFRPRGIINDKITFRRDLQYDEITQYLKNISNKSTPKRKISVETIGKTYIGRDMKLVKIEHPNVKNIMFIDAGIHAREWLAVITALYLISQLIDSDYTSPINKMNWYIVPVVNPDGFIYSNRTHRMHRKNMNFTACPKKNKYCGVDLNRNYDYKWGVHSEKQDPEAEDYAGANAFSETETQAIAKTLKRYLKNIKLYVALHSCACMILYPWGYTSKECSDAKDLIAAAQKAVDAMIPLKPKGRGCDWSVQNAGLFPGGGGADDYAKGSLKIKYSYTIELQEGDGDGFTYGGGFILPNVKQSYVGITTLADYVNNQYPTEK